MKKEQRAKEIIENILYVTIATVTPQGKPWNSPVYTAFDEDYNFFWASDKNGQHSINIKGNNSIFIVIYDSTVPEGTGKGVYIEAKAHELDKKEEILKALNLLDKRVGKSNKRNASEFLGDYPRRLYKAVPGRFWINGDGEANGSYIDIRTEVGLLNQNK